MDNIHAVWHRRPCRSRRCAPTVGVRRSSTTLGGGMLCALTAAQCWKKISLSRRSVSRRRVAVPPPSSDSLSLPRVSHSLVFRPDDLMSLVRKKLDLKQGPNHHYLPLIQAFATRSRFNWSSKWMNEWNVIVTPQGNRSILYWILKYQDNIQNYAIIVKHNFWGIGTAVLVYKR